MSILRLMPRGRTRLKLRCPGRILSQDGSPPRDQCVYEGHFDSLRNLPAQSIHYRYETD